MKFLPHVHHTKVSSKESVIQDNKASNYSNSSVHSSLMLDVTDFNKKATSQQHEVVPNGYSAVLEAFYSNWLK